jgi:probable DNA repair protein
MLFSELPPDILVVTPNERMARHLRARDDRQTREVLTWEPREILSWRSWLQTLWDEALDWQAPRPILLRPAQEAALWQQVLEDSPQGACLLNPRSAARTALEAWHLLHDHGCGLPPEDPFLDDDSKAFAGWAHRVATMCEARGWLDPARLLQALEAAIEKGQVALPPGLLLVGFDRIPPRHEAFLELLRRAGCDTRVWQDLGPPGDFIRTSWADPEAEATAAILWARGLLSQDPETRIALVVPDLGESRTLLERLLEDLLCPEAVLPGKARLPRPYNLSLGRPLANQGMVADALTLLHLAHSPLPLQQVGALLSSPHLGGAESERGRRGLLDAKLRRRLIPEAGLERLVRMAHPQGREGLSRPDACPLLADHLNRMLDLSRSLPRRQSPARWSESFDGLLQASGWPGERPVDGEDAQVRLRFREVLAELRGLDLVRPYMTYMQALGSLTSLCWETIFQPRRQEAPVQVLGFLEAAGLEFDATWMLGVHDEVWPPGARANPYLPLDLQRRMDMPGSSAPRELDFARRVTRRILAGAPHGIASHARSVGDRELRLSALLAHLPEGSPVLPEFRPWREVMHEAGGLQVAPDRPPPPCPTGEVTRGGTNLFKLQAACPFRAFAELRLGVRSLEAVQPGLAARERGTLLHETMEHAWRALRSQSVLLESAPERLAELITKAAEKALTRMTAQRPDVLTGRFRQIEQDRLINLALEWLEVERERSPFEVVGFEVSRRMEVAGLVFEARIDRLDRLQDGALAILDYKTGRPNPRHWLGDRPEDPQLPLYCSGTEEQTGAVLFAQVRPGDMRLKGVSRSPGLHPQVPCLADSNFAAVADDWTALLNHWRDVLASLGAQFRQGYCAVDPMRRDTCRYCTLQPVCRVYELRPFEDSENLQESS